MNLNKIGKIIETKRKEKKLTQQQLADLLGVSNTAISKWENGNNLPDILMLEPLSEILDLDLLSLITIQNNAHEECSKKCTKLRRIRTYKTIALIVIFISIICLTNYLTYNKTSNKFKTKSSNQVEVYQISSKDPDFRIDGYMIFNQKENIIILERLRYQGKDDYDIDYKKLEELHYYIIVNNHFVLKREINLKNEKISDLNTLYQMIPLTSSPIEYSLYKKKTDFNKVYFELELSDKDDNKTKIDVDLNVKRLFT